MARVAKLCETSGFEFEEQKIGWYDDLDDKLKNYRFDEALGWLWEVLKKTDQLIELEKPWALSGEKLKEVLEKLVLQVRLAGYNLQPFLPETAEKILVQFKGPRIESGAPLFPRIK